jgi:hypothetical protein
VLGQYFSDLRWRSSLRLAQRKPLLLGCDVSLLVRCSTSGGLENPFAFCFCAGNVLQHHCH